MEEAEWLTCECPDSACGRRLFFQQSDRVVSCAGCFRSHPLYQLLARARRANGPEVAEEDRQAFARWSAALATSGTHDGAAVDERSVGTCSSEEIVTRLRKHTARLGSRDLQCVLVRGLCGFQCKLLSPLLTYYGIDRSDGGKPVPLSQLYKKRRTGKTSGSGMPEERSSPGPADTSAGKSASALVETFDCSTFKDFAFSVSPEDLYTPGFGIDTSGSFDYLRDVLRIVKKHPANGSAANLVPLYTSGDGHCLVHAVSRALVGRELFWDPLQVGLRRHLEQNVERYKKLFADFITEESEWKQIIEESDPSYVPAASKDADSSEIQGLGTVHIQGLANLLRRPIIVLDAPEGIASFGYYSCVYLPLLHEPDDCLATPESSSRAETASRSHSPPAAAMDGVQSDHSATSSAASASPSSNTSEPSRNACTEPPRARRTKPICIAWNNKAHNHFVPLVAIQGSTSVLLYVNLNHLRIFLNLILNFAFYFHKFSCLPNELDLLSLDR